MLSFEEIKNIREYRYKGADSSMIYKYILRPMANSIAQKLPVWVAPNAITLYGLYCSMFSCILTVMYNPCLDSSGPRWLSLVNGVCLFLYQTLDNVDGHQARRTQSSSPLGMMFDHGCDAVNTCLCIIPISSIFGIGWRAGLTFGLFAGFVPFYAQTWEEFHLDEMVLPSVNGPTEGLLFIILSAAISYFYGAETWQQSPCSSDVMMLKQISQAFQEYVPRFCARQFTHFDVVLYMCSFLIIVTVLFQYFKVMIRTYDRMREYGVEEVNGIFSFNCKYFLLILSKITYSLIPFFLFCLSSCAWCLYEHETLSHRPLLSVLFVGLIFIDIVVQLMFDHIRKSHYSFSNCLSISFLAFFALNILFSSSELNNSILANLTTTFSPLNQQIDPKSMVTTVDKFLQVQSIFKEMWIVHPLFSLLLVIITIKYFLLFSRVANVLGIYTFRVLKKDATLSKDGVRFTQNPYCG